MRTPLYTGHFPGSQGVHNSRVALYTMGVQCLHWIIETGYCGSITGSALQSVSECTPTWELQDVDRKCTHTLVFANPRWTAPRILLQGWETRCMFQAVLEGNSRVWTVALEVRYQYVCHINTRSLEPRPSPHSQKKEEKYVHAAGTCTFLFFCECGEGLGLRLQYSSIVT